MKSKFPGIGTVLLIASLLLGMGRSTAIAASSEDRVRIAAHVSQDALRSGDQAQIALVLKVASGWHINSADPGVEGLLATEVRFDPPQGLTVGEWSYPEGHEQTFAFSPQPLSVYEGKVVLRAPIIATTLTADSLILEGSVRVQACNNRLCLRPGNAPFRLEIPVRAAGETIAAKNTELFQEVAASTEAPKPPTSVDSPGGKVAKLLEEKGTALAFLVFFGWGFVLCLTPCVFPMIPITAGYFANQSGGHRMKALILAVLYGQGLAIVYGILGTVAGLSGQLLGSMLQNPFVLLGIAVTLIILSLSMFGVYEFRIPGLDGGAEGRAGYLGAFFMGAFLGVVAAPCIGPFSVAMLAYIGQRGDPVFGFWAFFVMAQGLALPFMVLAAFTELSLPRSGEWMVWVKKVFGVLILGLALYFLSPLLPDSIEPWLFLIFAVMGSIYLAFLEKTGMHMPRFRAVKAFAGIVLIILAGVFFWSFQMTESLLNWNEFSVDALEQDREAGRVSMVDFFADWCIPCKELDHRTFSDPRVAKVLEGFSLYKANLTQGNETVKGWQREYQIIGVPTVVFYDGAGTERLRIEEFIGPDEFLRRLEAADLSRSESLVSSAAGR